MKHCRFVFLLLPLVLFVSCVTGPVPVVLDENESESELATVYFNSGDKRFIPSLINGVFPGKKVYAVKVKAGPATVTGEFNCLVMKGIEEGNKAKTMDKIFKKKNVTFLFNFEAGKSYYVESELDGEEGIRILINLPVKGTTRLSGPVYTGGVNIYEVTQLDKKQRPVVNGRNLVGFVFLEGNVTF